MPHAQVLHIALVNTTDRISSRGVHVAARALQDQVDRSLRHYWRGPHVVVEPFVGTPPASEWRITLVDRRPTHRTRAYHMLGAGRVPEAVVFVPTLGHYWRVGASHELLEMLENPRLGRIYHGYVREICDPVESIWYRTVSGIWVSDFVTPAWYGSGRGPWDAARQLRTASSFSRGGKAGQLDQDGRVRPIGPGAHRKRYPAPIKLAGRQAPRT